MIIRALLLAIAVALAGAAPAVAVPFLDAGDAAELAQSLADANAEQGVCYAWQVAVSDASGGPSGFDTGSNLGPNPPTGTSVSPTCERTVTLRASVSYTCSSCESEDSSSVSVSGDFPGAPTTADLKGLGLDGGDLKKDDGDVTLINMVGALPLITASKGSAAAVPVEPATVAPSATDKPTNTPSVPDWLRQSWLALSALLVVVIGGVIWLLAAVKADASRRRQQGGAAVRAPRISTAPPE